ncbi:cyclin-domain-containing protein [Aureobasidium pullulans]|uniref:Cyclin-domain-containing protein n=1 Tax=Aureobasidium pullulans TaxID=5580 RepID=A0A4S9BHW5_AURPU|nr:cyclin-domain-containing protein [Aureobasidium pullulans]
MHMEVAPPKPNPESGRLLPHEYHAGMEQTNEPLMLKDENWDLYSVSPVAAVQMLAQALQSLSNITGDVTCTTPVYQRQQMFKTPATIPEGSNPPSPDSITPPAHTPELEGSPTLAPHHCVPVPHIGAPEAQRDEPIAPPANHSPEPDIAEANALQLAAVSRRFFLKAAPPFSITDYLLRIHKFSPHSPGVYLAAASYIHRLCVVETMVPATPRTVHRLALAAIRIASKSLEDNKWTQERIARLGGISTNELRKLEISFCYLLNFDLFLRPEDLQRSMWLLQSTGRQGLSVRRRLSEGFIMRLPSRFLPEATIGA